MATRLHDAAQAGKAAIEADLTSRARSLAEDLGRRAAETEKLRRLPDRTHEDFRGAGFYRVLQPARFGGLELDYGAQTLIARELARGCASSAWVCSILACHAWVAGMFPPDAQADIWDDKPDALVATSFLPVGISVERKAAAGMRISGRWRFSSGVDRCRWAILLVPVPTDDGPADPRFALVDLRGCRIETTWNSVGLAGTGSNDIVVDKVDVPTHRVVRVLDLRGGPTAGSEMHGSYLYRLPLFGVFPFNIVGPALGAARGALDDVVMDMKHRRSVTGADLTQVATVHQRIGRATALLDAADAVVASLRAEIVTAGLAGRDFSLDDRARYRLNLGHVARSCCDAVDELLPLTGGRGLETAHPMQRAWRDVHAAAQHVGLVWDVQTGLYSNVLLGNGSPDPKL